MSNYIVECRNKTALEINPNQPFGQFTTNIQDKIQLEEGDTIIMKSAFIDTEASSQQKIIIDQDLDLELNWVNYVINDGAFGIGKGSVQPTIGRVGLSPLVSTFPAGGDGNDNCDAELYLLTEQSTPATADFYESSPISFSITDSAGQSPNYGGFNIYFNYTDINGDKLSNKIYIQEETLEYLNTQSLVGGAVSPFYNFNAIFDNRENVNISAGEPSSDGSGGNGFIMAGNGVGNSGTGLKPTYNNCYITGYDTNLSFPTGTWSKQLLEGGTHALSHYPPQKFSKTITLLEGNYEPLDLCEAINRQLVVVGENPTQHDLPDNDFLRANVIDIPSTDPTHPDPARNPGLFNNYLVNPKTGLNATSNNEVLPVDYRFCIGADGTGATDLLPRLGNSYIGASQVSMSFDANTQRFFWEYLHMPYYSNGQEAVGFANVMKHGTDPAVRNTVVQAQHGGIVLTGLSAINTKTGTVNNNFWSKSLGFNLDRNDPLCCLGQYKLEINYDFALTGGVVRDKCFKAVFNPPLKLGVQITGGYMGIDKGVAKTDTTSTGTYVVGATTFFYTKSFAFNPWAISSVDSFDDTAGFFYSTSLKTTPIDANVNILQGSDLMTYGYYLIEVQANFQNNFITTDENRRNVMGIVSRYYVNDSYTSASEDASLIYTHQGEPMILSSFNIRILDSEKVLATNIGRDNTVFLNIIKADLKKIKTT